MGMAEVGVDTLGLRKKRLDYCKSKVISPRPAMTQSLLCARPNPHLLFSHPRSREQKGCWEGRNWCQGEGSECQRCWGEQPSLPSGNSSTEAGPEPVIPAGAPPCSPTCPLRSAESSRSLFKTQWPSFFDPFQHLRRMLLAVSHHIPLCMAE